MFELIPFGQIRRANNFDPFRELEEMSRDLWSGRSALGFRADVIDTGDAYELQAELPGFKKEELKLDVENDVLTISAERSYDKNEEKNGRSYIKRERVYGSFSRSFDVSGVEVDGISASYNDGVLSVKLPKKQETIPAKRSLEIQ